ncbi:MAG TPA: hypothetical protein VF235_00215 [Actinomycetota bacterium]
MEPRDDEPARRSSFEDFENPVPAPSARPRRSGIVVTAAAVLAVNGLLNVLLVALFRPSGSIVWLYLALGALQVGAAVLVVLLRPIGRTLGLVLGGLGIVLALVRAPDDALSALLSVALNAFVLYALGVSGPSFRRG